MEDSTQKQKDSTEESSRAKSTTLEQKMIADDGAELTGANGVPAPDGDSAGENRVATSLDNE